MRKPITIVGNVNVDLVMGPQAPWPLPGTEVMLPEGGLRIGGSAGNAGLALAGLGHPFRIVASRGNDVLGRWLAEGFGPLASAWEVDPGATTVSVGISHPDGERTFFTAPGHLSTFDLQAALRQLPVRSESGGIALLVGAFVSPALIADYGALLVTLRTRGFSIALDTGWPSEGWTAATRDRAFSWLDHVDHLLLNEAEVLGLTGAADPGAAIAALHRAMPAGGIVVVKQGPAGALLAKNEATIERPAPIVSVVDTIGAGDCFNAGYLAAVSDGAGLAQAVEQGIAVASAAISTNPRSYAFGKG
jgi:sugar/nucleoside kinase (ribokinase family)